MTKVKTKKIVAKRFKLTASGKIMRGRQMGRHLRLKKSKARIRRQKEPGRVTNKFAQKIRGFMPYA